MELLFVQVLLGVVATTVILLPTSATVSLLSNASAVGALTATIINKDIEVMQQAQIDFLICLA